MTQSDWFAWAFLAVNGFLLAFFISTLFVAVGSRIYRLCRSRPPEPEFAWSDPTEGWDWCDDKQTVSSESKADPPAQTAEVNSTFGQPPEVALIYLDASCTDPDCPVCVYLKELHRNGPSE